MHCPPDVISLVVPFNPVLGETLQKVGSNGERAYCEQSCHHPAICKWLLEGPDGLYTHSGSAETTAAIKGA